MGGWKTDEELVTIYTPTYETKTCPRCGATMFSDMEVCYACLGQEEERPATASRGLSLQIVTDALSVVLPLPDRGLVVGRGPSCDIVLHARAVSRQHVRIEPSDEGVLVSDLGATNVALLRNEELHGTQTLNVGDELRVCNASFILRESGEASQ